MTMTSAEFNYIRDLVRDHSALMLEPGKEYLVESRLNPLVRQGGFPSFHRMVEALRSGAFCELHRRVVEAMTTNETSFFRDARVFGMLKKTLLPELVARRRCERSLNIWCAGCSSGQEPYSVAMLLRDVVPDLDSWNIRIVASDLSRDVLVRARAGRYSQLEVNRGLPATLLVKYFDQHRGAWEIAPELRSMVEFREINLIDYWPLFPRMDVVFLRNVLIYLDRETKQQILRKVGRLVVPDGYLLLGGAETTTNLDDSFESVALDGAMCFRLKRKKTDRPCSAAVADVKVTAPWPVN
jgi:chemotaxis protein methyltransferase CheR